MIYSKKTTKEVTKTKTTALFIISGLACFVFSGCANSPKSVNELSAYSFGYDYREWIVKTIPEQISESPGLYIVAISDGYHYQWQPTTISDLKINEVVNLVEINLAKQGDPDIAHFVVRLSAKKPEKENPKSPTPASAN